MRTGLVLGSDTLELLDGDAAGCTLWYWCCANKRFSGKIKLLYSIGLWKKGAAKLALGGWEPISLSMLYDCGWIGDGLSIVGDPVCM